MAVSHSISKRKLVYGIGINDADYAYSTCPFYLCWSRMLQRCYSSNIQSRQPTYAGCTVCVEWHSFMAFRAWMKTQDWIGNQLDKDLIGNGKLYSPDNCVFVSSQLNSLFTESGANRGKYPIGVSWNKGKSDFRGTISIDGKCKQLGRFASAEEAHAAWYKAKLEIAQRYLESEKNPRARYAIECGIAKLQAKYGSILPQ